MKINLGLYILDCEFKEIGSIVIQNNYNKELNYLIRQEVNNTIIISNKNNKELNSNEDLKIHFKFNIKNINSGFYHSKYEIYLYDNKIESDKCIIHAFINVIPLIIKFSIPNERFSINNNIISISHYIEKLKILYSFPGNYYPKSLGMQLKSSDYNKININKQNKGEIIIDSNNNNNKLNYELNLFLLSYLFKFTIDYRKSKYSGLVLYDEKKIYEKKNFKIKIIKKMTKNINLFNMSNSNINLNIKYNESEIKLDLSKNEIQPGKHILIEIENINILNYTKLNINNYELIIENGNLPKISKNNNYSQCNFDMELVGINKFKIIFIKKNFSLEKRKICDKDMNNFSTYLIFNNKIIEEKKSNYNCVPLKENRRYYGFSDDEFILCNYEDIIKLKIILSLEISKREYSKCKTIFNNKQREEFKSCLEKFKKK